MKIQITLFSDKGFRPISTLVEVASAADYKANKAVYQKKAIVRMLASRGWTDADRAAYGYNKLMQREYDIEKIKKENAERYERIKKERGWIKDDGGKPEENGK